MVPCSHASLLIFCTEFVYLSRWSTVSSDIDTPNYELEQQRIEILKEKRRALLECLDGSERKRWEEMRELAATESPLRALDPGVIQEFGLSYDAHEVK